ncbi:MAG: PEP/pyruvate-binding domain-containing protein [Blastocatellales bacterium]
MKYVIDANTSDRQRLGGKAAALASLGAAQAPIPEWFALTPEAFDASLRDETRREIALALAVLCPNGERVAVRSSAIDEDGRGHSFAGQFDSFLFVSPEDVADMVTAVWQSASSERVFGYRQTHNLSLIPNPPAVLIQRMINADRAGVAFSADPVTGRRGVAVVAAVYGLGSSLVAGECDADTYHINRAGQIIQRDIAAKRWAYRFNDGAVISVAVPADEANLPALTDREALEIAQLARLAEKHFGCPQDIEWAIERGRLYLLQSRPITALANMVDPDGALNLWDNSNIAESYGGVTLPLTFSFARLAYEEVYRQFCRLMRVPAVKIAAHDNTFRRMLGLVRGRVYYNLLNWYRVLALLPGFKINRRFMEQMMGVKESLPNELLGKVEGAGLAERLKDGAHLLTTLGGLLANHLLLERRIKDFYERLNDALREPQPAIEEMRPDELAEHYRELEQRLLTRWDAPLVNDFFAMIFVGLLRRLSERWSDEIGLHNALLCGEGGVISAEPARRVREMARLAAADAEFVKTLCEGSLNEMSRAMARVEGFRSRYKEYLARFGDRCLDELKLESETLRDDPLPLLRSIGQLGGHLARRGLAFDANGNERELRCEAEVRMRAAFKGQPLRRAIFGWVLSIARARVRERENLRFERTRLFGRVRRIFVELGRRFHALDLLAEPRDIFYLEVEEALGFIEGVATTIDLKSLVAVRQAEYARRAGMKAPADRFSTRGIVHHANTFKNEQIKQTESGPERRGLGCCPGVVRGRARVVRDPRNAEIQAGEILIAERTDPGWIMLFPSAAGLVVERGSLLSHSAIVARELGIPAVVSVAGVTEWLRTGDEIELDGGAGIVRRCLEARASSPARLSQTAD